MPHLEVREDSHKQRNAYQRVDLEKSLVDVLWDECPRESVLPEKCAGGEKAGHVVTRSKVGGATECPEKDDRNDV